MRALGQFEGGKLLYWNKDPFGIRVERLHRNDAVECDVHCGFVPINGRCAHEVTEYTGTRYSVVFFTVEGYAGASASVWEPLQGLGFKWPSYAALADLLTIVPVKLLIFLVQILQSGAQLRLQPVAPAQQQSSAGCSCSQQPQLLGSSIARM